MSRIPFNRLSLWWNHLILPFSFWVYLVGFRQGISLSSVSFCMLLLAASACMASFGYIVNDYFDRVPDRSVGKRNFFDGHSRTKTITIEAVVVGGAALWSLLPLRPFTIGLLLFECALFFIYSAPPVRLKNRNSGIVVDALYSRVVPVLTVLSFNEPLLWYSILLVCIWLFAIGIRNILLHQIDDVANDLTARQNTFVLKYGTRSTQHIILGLILPFELILSSIALILLMDQIDRIHIILPIFILTVILRFKVWRSQDRSLDIWEERVLFLPNNLYEDFLPIGLLVIVSISEPIGWLLVAVHLLVFPNSTGKLFNSIWSILLDLKMSVLSGYRTLVHYLRFRVLPQLRKVGGVVITRPIIWLFRLAGINLKKENLSVWEYIRQHLKKP